MALDDDSIDKMLDDLKTTVTPDGERSSSRKDNSLSSFRSSSRSESRNSNRSGIEDGGHMKHHHKEFTSPDKSTRIVSDQFEYDSGDPTKQYQKKVMKSTYSNYKVTGDLSSDLDSLRQGPDPSTMAAARAMSDQHTDNTRVVSASQKVANKLVDALSTIGPDGKVPDGESNTSTMTSDYSTLTRLNKNINELDSMLEAMDEEEEQQPMTITAAVATHRTTVVQTAGEQQHQQDLSNPKRQTQPDQDLPHQKKQQLDQSVNVETTSFQQTQSDGDKHSTKSGGEPATSKGGTEGPTNAYSTNSYSSSKTTKHSTTGMTNGKLSYDDEDDAEIIHDPTGGEVRKIVWRNRFEKTYEGQDGTPSITIEEEARRRNQKNYEKTTTSTLSTVQPQPPQRGPLPRGPLSPRQLQLQYAVYWPNLSPNISPGGQSWADPIPMPTPPQMSPKGEPGVAYVYTYGQSGSQVQHLPPVNYVTGPSIPPSEGAPSPTPSGTQPIIYHYSYHYNIQPGQPIPDGIPQPHGSHPHQPALQMAPHTDSVPVKPINQQGTNVSSYDYKKHNTRTYETTTDNTTNIHHLHQHPPPGGISDPQDPHGSIGPHRPHEPHGSHGPHRPHEPHGPHDPHRPHEPHGLHGPHGPHDRPGDSGYPKDGEPRPFPSDGQPNPNISITINKSSSHVTHSKEYPSGGPSTSTPFPTTGRRSRSTSPDRYPRAPGTGPHGTITHVTHTTHDFSDSLDRVRRHPNEGLPFPDTSPIKHREVTKFPKRVDDLMTSLSDSEDGPHGTVDVRGLNGPRPPHEREPLISAKLSSSGTEVAVSDRKAEIKREETKNVAGPPVYYPPGHHQLFDESMHTMTLKENKRRGMAKWRMEKASGYKESSSSSESKGGMAMVPVCLPLCCGAACVVM